MLAFHIAGGVVLLASVRCGAIATLTPGVPTIAIYFHGDAVVQRDTAVTVWGTANGGGNVSLYIDGSYAADATVSSDDKWIAKLPPYSASAKRTLTAVGSKGESSVNVTFGDVLLCSGQSNMDMPLDNLPDGFKADDGADEVANADQYTGKISLFLQMLAGDMSEWKSASSGALQYPNKFSALCWFAGKKYFHELGGKVHVGLIDVAVGGTPIEYWLSAESIAKCEVDSPQCKDGQKDSVYYDAMVSPLQPYTIGAFIWDQAEADLKCNHVETYSCMLKELVNSWRSGFQSPNSVFVNVQLQDFYKDEFPGTPGYPGYARAADGVFAMRMAQDKGIDGLDKVSAIATYDQSCNDQAFPDKCPRESIHNLHKQVIGKRVAAQLMKLMAGANIVAEGPRAQKISAYKHDNGEYSVHVNFDGGSSALAFASTRNCTSCCNSDSSESDFAASSDGVYWTAGTNAHVENTGVTFHIETSDVPAYVRYTGVRNFTQCALYNAEGYPAWPFQMDVSTGTRRASGLSTLSVGGFLSPISN